MGPKKKKKEDRTPAEQRKIDENRANKGKKIGKWDEATMREAVER